MNVPRLRRAPVFVALVLVLIACGVALFTVPAEAPTVVATSRQASPTALAMPQASPTLPATLPPATPTPPHAKQIGNDIQVAGVDVSGLTAGAAQERLETALAPLFTPLTLQVGTITTTLAPADVGLKLPFDSMVAAALAADDGARIPLQASYDDTRVHAALQTLAVAVDTQPTFQVITATNQISRSFTLTPGVRLDQQLAAQLIGTRLRTVNSTRTISLTLAANTGNGHPAVDLLQQQLTSITATSRGIVGVSVYDLDNETTIAQVNPNTVFSAASVMKAAIMLQAYVHLATFTDQQTAWLQQMIIDSDNSAANQLLAATLGGKGYAGTVAAANDMTEMLRSLGLQHTYQYAPYLADDLVIPRNARVNIGPVREGDPPYTNADRFLRSTPAEMSKVFLLIAQCSQGRGALLEAYGDKLTPARCQEMVDLLHQNADTSRLVAGFPTGTYVAHKSGWIDDVQADVGIVHTPGGSFLVAVFINQSTGMDPETAAPIIPAIAHLVCTYYNPLTNH